MKGESTMQWSEGWANDGDALESSFTEDGSSMMSHEMDHSKGELNERLSAVADSLAFPQTRSVRDALIDGDGRLHHLQMARW